MEKCLELEYIKIVFYNFLFVLHYEIYFPIWKSPLTKFFPFLHRERFKTVYFGAPPCFQYFPIVLASEVVPGSQKKKQTKHLLTMLWRDRNNTQTINAASECAHVLSLFSFHFAGLVFSFYFSLSLNFATLYKRSSHKNRQSSLDQLLAANRWKWISFIGQREQ